jgi:hypothetical protein
MHHPPHPKHARTFLQQLAREESLLRDALANVTVLHGALRRGALAESLTYSTEQAALGVALREAADARTASALELAREVGLTGEDLTLSALAAKLPESLAAEVRDARARLAGVTAELSAVHTDNANLIGHLRSFFRGVLSGLATPGAPQRYGPSGGRVESAGGAVQAHG